MQILNFSYKKEDAKNLQPLILAQIGDSVQTLYARKFVALNCKVKANMMTKLVAMVCNAGAQFDTFKRLERELEEDETAVALRARNTHIHSKSKNYSYEKYIYATALEAVIGYLYLSGETSRLEQILSESIKALKEKTQN